MFKLLFALIKNLIILGVIGGVAWTGYNYFLVDQVEPPALPNPPGYKTVDGQDISGYIRDLGEQVSDVTNQPELMQAVGQVDDFIRCYRDVGAVRARLYSHEETPLSSGFVAIADRNEMLNPLNLFECVGTAGAEGAQRRGVAIEPCTANYTVARDNNEYYIIYAGTTAEICQAFCSELEGCTAH